MKSTCARGLVVAALFSAVALGTPQPVSAAPAEDGTDLYVERRPTRVPTDPGEPVRVASNAETRVLGRTVGRSGAPMPITGGDVAGLAAMGLGAIGVGTALVRRGRRTT